MTAPLYDAVHCLALDIANASAVENIEAGAEAYDALKELCEGQEGSDLDHPLQWETLGDFSENYKEAIAAYQKGLSCAIKLELPEYSASIKFAMAESHYEQNNKTQALKLATAASTEAEGITNNELKAAINEFLNELRHT